MNKLNLLGEVRRAPVYHCTTSGRDLTRFEIITTDDRGLEGVHHCLAWGPAALDLHENLRRGDRLMVKGTLRYRWRKLVAGRKFRVAEILVRGYTYLGKGEAVTFRRAHPHQKNADHGDYGHEKAHGSDCTTMGQV